MYVELRIGPLQWGRGVCLFSAHARVIKLEYLCQSLASKLGLSRHVKLMSGQDNDCEAAVSNTWIESLRALRFNLLTKILTLCPSDVVESCADIPVKEYGREPKLVQKAYSGMRRRYAGSPVLSERTRSYIIEICRKLPTKQPPTGVKPFSGFAGGFAL